MLRFLIIWGVVLTASALPACTSVRPVGFWSRNQRNARQERQGPWREYHDANEHHVAAKGRFRRDYATGRWRYYTPAGTLEKVEHLPRSGGLVRLRYYHANGKLSRKGHARYVNEPSGPHFYWFGRWRTYDEQGKLRTVETYQMGQLIGVR